MSDAWVKAVALATRKPLPNGDSSRRRAGMFEQHRHAGDQAQAQSFSTRTGPAGAFLDDGRRIDFVLVYQVTDTEFRKSHSSSKTATSDKAQRRAFFESNLIKEGLVLEKDEWSRKGSTAPEAESSSSSAPTSTSTTTVFVKVHGSFATLCRYAERLNVKVPLKLRDAFALASNDGETDGQGKCSRLDHACHWVRHHSIKQLPSIFRRDHSNTTALMTPTGPIAPTITIQSDTASSSRPHGQEKEPEKAPYVTHRFRRRNMNMYAGIERQDEFFTPTQRIEIVWEILQNARNDKQDEKKRGIELLIETGVYECAFPLHDSEDTADDESDSAVTCTHARAESANRIQSQRQLLKRTWANWKFLAKPQPLSVIRRYYGEKVAFYFSFLGFYTWMLLYPGVFGMAVFLYGLIGTEADLIIQDVCSPEVDRIMCPICKPPRCGFTNLSEGCINATWNYHTDNPSTLILACFSVVWATVFLKMWKRREAELAYEWDTYDIKDHEQGLRPGYEQCANDRRPNPVTRELEPYVPTHVRFLRSVLSTCVTLLMLCAVGVVLVCLVMGRIELYRVFKRAKFTYYVELGRWSAHGLIFITVVLFDAVYDRVARRLTSLECPRTSCQWLTSFLWKVFIFELLNDFIPICYVAWVKGKTTRTPSEMTWYSEMCEGGGCLGEVTELVAVLLLARLMIGNAAEIGIPFAKRVYAQTFRFRNKKAPESSGEDAAMTPADRRPWRLDYLLGKVELDGVAEEYMEMAVQFAYCTLFVPALPVAPLLCLLNNILEIRVDAINLTAAHRRPLPVRVAGIGIWSDFLNIVTKLAVFCNAALIAFTSQTVQRLHYSYLYAKPFDSYHNATLSVLPASNWTDEYKAAAAELPYNISECWYADYRYDHYPYNVRREWWETMCARVGAFAAFVLASFMFQWFFNFVISDVPTHVKLKMQRRRYIVTKATEAGGAYDLWLSKAVRRESTVPRRSTSGPPICRSDHSARTVVVDTGTPGEVREGEKRNQEPHSEGSVSDVNTTPVMFQRSKRVTFVSRPSMQARNIHLTRNQETLDAVDIEEEDMERYE